MVVWQIYMCVKSSCSEKQKPKRISGGDLGTGQRYIIHNVFWTCNDQSIFTKLIVNLDMLQASFYICRSLHKYMSITIVYKCIICIICIYVYMYMYIYVYMNIYVYMYIYICIYVYMYICIYVYMYICICVYVYMCICVYMYICIYVYM